MASSELDMLLPVIIFYGVLIGGLLLTALLNYIFSSIGMYAEAKKQRFSSPWMAYIPYARQFLFGNLAGSIQFARRKIKEPGIWTLVVPMVVNISIVVIYIWYVISAIFGSIKLAGNVVDENVLIGEMIGKLSVFLVFILIVGVFGQAAVHALRSLVYFQIYRTYMIENMAVLHTVLGLFIPLYASVYLFLLRKKTPLLTASVEEEIEKVQEVF